MWIVVYFFFFVGYVFDWGGVGVFEDVFVVGVYVCVGEFFSRVDYVWGVGVGVWVRVFGVF